MVGGASDAELLSNDCGRREKEVGYYLALPSYRNRRRSMCMYLCSVSMRIV